MELILDMIDDQVKYLTKKGYTENQAVELVKAAALWKIASAVTDKELDGAAYQVHSVLHVKKG